MCARERGAAAQPLLRLFAKSPPVAPMLPLFRLPALACSPLVSVFLSNGLISLGCLLVSPCLSLVSRQHRLRVPPTNSLLPAPHPPPDDFMLLHAGSSVYCGKWCDSVGYFASHGCPCPQVGGWGGRAVGWGGVGWGGCDAPVDAGATSLAGEFRRPCSSSPSPTVTCRRKARSTRSVPKAPPRPSCSPTHPPPHPFPTPVYEPLRLLYERAQGAGRRAGGGMGQAGAPASWVSGHTVSQRAACERDESLERNEPGGEWGKQVCQRRGVERLLPLLQHEMQAAQPLRRNAAQGSLPAPPPPPPPRRNVVAAAHGWRRWRQGRRRQQLLPMATEQSTGMPRAAAAAETALTAGCKSSQVCRGCIRWVAGGGGGGIAGGGGDSEAAACCCMLLRARLPLPLQCRPFCRQQGPHSCVGTLLTHVPL